MERRKGKQLARAAKREEIEVKMSKWLTGQTWSMSRGAQNKSLGVKRKKEGKKKERK
jgi:hypothetical protein